MSNGKVKVEKLKRRKTTVQQPGLFRQEFIASASDKRIKHPMDVVIRRAKRFGDAHPELKFAGCLGSVSVTGYYLLVAYRKTNARL